jgi:hypothetical protein
MKEPEFLREIHENQIKAHEERVKSGITLMEFMLSIEKESEEKIQTWGIKKFQQETKDQREGTGNIGSRKK